MRNMNKDADIPTEEEPILEMGLGIYLEAFNNLDRRTHYNGPEYIKWIDVQSYAEKNNFDRRQTEYLHHFIVKMDEYEVGRVAKEQEKQRKRMEN